MSSLDVNTRHPTLNLLICRPGPHPRRHGGLYTHYGTCIQFGGRQGRLEVPSPAFAVHITARDRASSLHITGN